MYRHNERQTILPDEFFLPFGGKLNPSNRWCQLASIVPWDVVEDKYAVHFTANRGRPAYSVRMALGALIIQNRRQLSDRDLVEEVMENPYLQYFIGLHSFAKERPFDHSTVHYFRERFGADIINEINELIVKAAVKSKGSDGHPPASADSDGEKPTAEPPDNAGTLLLDATCVPADIHYPTDPGLLNKTREALEEIIDVLWEPHAGTEKKPRTYRQLARRSHISFDKKRIKSHLLIRKSVGKQLRYIKRNIKSTHALIQRSSLSLLSSRQYKNLLVCQEIHRQQLEMYKSRTHTTPDRIVSLHMPFVRPIVRGKAGTPVEFGAKLAISNVNGYSFMERVSFDPFNEANTLMESVENYRRRFGTYPQAVIADKIYRNRENLAFCKQRGIRLSGPPLGRPTKDEALLKQQKRDEREDARTRNRIEAVFGEGKRFYGLGRVMTRLKETSETVIAIQLMVMNLERRLRVLFVHFLRLLVSRQKGLLAVI